MKILFSKYTAFLAIVTITLFTFSCKEDPDTQPALSGELKLEFDHFVGQTPLSLHDREYSNANGDKFKVSRFKYYLSNIMLKKADGTEYRQPESYYLVDESVAASKVITLSDVPAGEYTQLTFTIGVDSTRNVSGAQTGALDPSHGMFWNQNSGYVFVKLEGSSPQSQDGNLVFHIGGFKTPNNTIRTVSPSLNGQQLRVQAGKAPQVHLKADVLDMFQGPNLIKFAEFSNTIGGPNSVKVADNYADMFRVDHIHN
ncbi:MAG: MbnP family protein [Adhaeribacter sp.]